MRLGAFSSRDFRLLWVGLGISQIGTQVQRVAVAWQLYKLTHSPLSLGLLGLFRATPVILLALLGGVVADSFERRRVMLVTQTVLTLSSAALALLTVTNTIGVAAIYALSFVAGCAAAFDAPARQSLIPALVPREHLPNALSLGITTFQVASVVGPGLGGLLLDAGGVYMAYLVDAGSFLGVIGALAAMRIRVRPPATARVTLGATLEGLRFLRGQRIILGTMLLDFFGTLLGGATLLMPIFADEVLHIGARGLGWLVAAPGVGAVLAALLLSWLPEVRARGPVLLISVAIYGLAMAGFGMSRVLWLALVMLALSGAADTVSTVLRQTIRQLLTPDEMRGRMTSLTMVFFIGGPQLGEAEAGLVARLVGAPLSVTLGGLGCALLAGVFALAFPSVRRHHA